MARKRYGPVGSSYNSKKYLAMHNANISAGLRAYHARRRAANEGDSNDIFALTMASVIVLCLLIGFITNIAK